MATDTQSLYNLANCFRCFGGVSEAKLLKLGLLVSIVKTLNPMQATDPQTLLNQPNINCFRSCGIANLGDLFEMALLQIIANNINPGGGGTSGAGAPTSATQGTFYFNTVDSTIWANNNGTWHQIV